MTNREFGNDLEITNSRRVKKYTPQKKLLFQMDVSYLDFWKYKIMGRKYERHYRIINNFMDEATSLSHNSRTSAGFSSRHRPKNVDRILQNRPQLNWLRTQLAMTPFFR